MRNLRSLALLAALFSTACAAGPSESDRVLVVDYTPAFQRAIATELFEWAQNLRQPDGSYMTGWVPPEQLTFPADERSTYTAASIILAADALDGSTSTAPLFADHRFLPEILEIDPVDEPARD